MQSFFWTTLARIRAFLRPGDLERDFEDELQTHLALAEQDHLRRGMTPDEARRAARVELGGLSQVREAGRAARGLPWLSGFWLDIKLGLRMLRKSWGLTLVGGLAMTIAIGPGAIVFALIETALWRPLPLDEGDRVVAIQTWDMAAYRRVDTALSDFERWRDTLRSVVDVGAFQTTEHSLDAPGGSAERVLVAEMTASGFRLARVAPLLGRPLVDDDERVGASPVVVIGHDVWQSRFASDPGVVGQTIRLDGMVHTVVGVMPEGFTFPVNHRFWVPLRVDPLEHLFAGPDGSVFARLAPGASLESAQAELTSLGLLQTDARQPIGPQPDTQRQPIVVQYVLAFTDDVQRGGELAVQFGIPLLLASLLLVPPCANTAILIYARTVMRQEEFATRYALGASRSRIVVQLFLEVLILAAGAAGLALVLVPMTMGQAEAIFARGLSGFGGLPFWWDFSLSPATIAFALALAGLAAVIAGLIPALQATGRLLRSRFRSLGQSTGVQLGAMWTTMVAVQIALALAVLPSAAEVAWGTLRPGVLGPGFPANEFLTARLATDTETRPSGEAGSDQRVVVPRLANLQAEVIRQLQTTPGVLSSVTVAAAVPGEEPTSAVEIDEGAAGARRIRRYTFRVNRVDEAFFDVFDIPLVAGRGFAPGDFGTTRDAVIVDRTFAEQTAGVASPLGRRIRPAARPGTEPGVWYEIVGVVADLPANTSRGRMYFAADRAAPAASGQNLLLRVGSTPTEVAGRLREIAARLDPTLRVEEVRLLDEVYRWQQGGSNLVALGLALVTLSVLLLSAAGLYALMSFTVARRRREIGIRSALGAQPRRLLAGIFTRALLQVAIGAGAGVLAAALLHRALNVEVMGGWHLPGVLPAAAAFMILIGLLSAALPARRALRVDPTEALRDDG